MRGECAWCRNYVSMALIKPLNSHQTPLYNPLPHKFLLDQPPSLSNVQQPWGAP